MSRVFLRYSAFRQIYLANTHKFDPIIKKLSAKKPLALGSYVSFFVFFVRRAGSPIALPHAAQRFSRLVRALDLCAADSEQALAQQVEIEADKVGARQ